MNPDLNTVLDAAMKLPPEQRAELKRRLDTMDRPARPKTGDVTRCFGMIDSGDPRSADNERIDADLAEAYLDDHAPEN